MSYCCEKIATIELVLNNSYHIDLDDGFWCWKDYMFEENFNDMGTKKIIIPEGWEFDKVENGEILLKESKKELPKTWEDCRIMLKEEDKEYFNDICETLYIGVPKGLLHPIIALCQLLECRHVYRKGWEPDWEDDSTKYYIEYFDGEIDIDQNLHFSRVLSFQSKEIRDKFLENFRDLIEEAKELI